MQKNIQAAESEMTEWGNDFGLDDNSGWRGVLYSVMSGMFTPPSGKGVDKKDALRYLTEYGNLLDWISLALDEKGVCGKEKDRMLRTMGRVYPHSWYVQTRKDVSRSYRNLISEGNEYDAALLASCAVRFLTDPAEFVSPTADTEFREAVINGILHNQPFSYTPPEGYDGRARNLSESPRKLLYLLV